MTNILFLGDSITAAYPTAEMLGEFSILKKGIDGDNTDHVLARLDRDVVNLHPHAVFLLVGTNDMASGFSDAKTLENFQTILSRLRSALPAAALFVQSILPTRGLENRPLERIAVLNAGIRPLAASVDAQYLDLTPLFADADGTLSNACSDDGLHLTAAAYRTWSEYLRPIIAALE